MSRILIDVSNFMRTGHLTGIQRVVRKLIGSMMDLGRAPELFCYDREKKLFYDVPAEGFRESRPLSPAGKGMGYDFFAPGDILFDIDSVHHSPLPRAVLYPELKARGVRIVIFLQDIIPVLWPDYVEKLTQARFLGLFSACLEYADLILLSARSNITDIQQVAEAVLPGRAVRCRAIGLGMDFYEPKGEPEISERIREITEGAPYVLMVGTVEPRKNHALILDAFDAGLYGEGYRLVIAGKMGWNVKALEERIRSHAQFGKGLVYLDRTSDAELYALYRGCEAVAFPSFAEGYGLPAVEGMCCGARVLCSDIPVLREVTEGKAEYFDPGDAEGFAGLLRMGKPKTEPEPIRRTSWEEVTRSALSAIEELTDLIRRPEEKEAFAPGGPLRQMLILTGRSRDLLRCLPYLDAYMPFLEELVLCCPAAVAREVKGGYQGRLSVRYITDEELLGGDPLPEDHSRRNIFLRTRAVARPEVDPIFLMSDDDYLPLREMGEDFFLDWEKGRYIAYHQGDLRRWRGSQGSPTSFDRLRFTNREFCMAKGLPTYMFDVHMPEVICKEAFLRMSAEYPEIEAGAASAWSGYFNYLLYKVPELVELRPYETLCWPGHLKDFEPDVGPADYSFENFYEELYGETDAYGDPGIFRGLHPGFGPHTPEESSEKIRRMRSAAERHDEDLAFYRKWEEELIRTFGICPVWSVTRDGNVAVTRCFEVKAGAFLRIPFSILDGEEESIATPDAQWQMTWSFLQQGELRSTLGSARFNPMDRELEILMEVPEVPGEYDIEFHLFSGKKTTRRMQQVTVKAR